MSRQTLIFICGREILRDLHYFCIRIDNNCIQDLRE